MAPELRVLALSFPDSDSANTVAALLHRDYPPEAEVHVAPLGHLEYPTPPGTLVTGRFSAGDVAAVTGLVHKLGGTVEMNVAYVERDR